MLPAAIEALNEHAHRVGNASSLHSAGRRARAAVEEAREQIAAAVGATPSEVIFTSGGTEADNLAIKGTYAAAVRADPQRTLIVTSATEHHAVLDPVEYLVTGAGAQAHWLDVDRCGHVSVDELRSVLATRSHESALVSVMWANNEVGTVQPIAEIADVARSYGIPSHSDAVQAVGFLDVDFAASGLDLLSLSGHKVGGPTGVGVLLARRAATLVPLAHGGGQERHLRSGTLDVAGIAALAAAITETVAQRASETQRVGALRDRLIAGALALDLGITVTGCWTAGDTEKRLANNAHVLVPGCEGDALLYLLDAAGVECSTGSACQAGVPQPSHVVLAMGYTEAQARGALRLSLGHSSTAADVDACVAALPAVVARARRAAGVA